MARNTNAIYTNYPLLKDSDALQGLDAFCQEWGGISRADATQRLMIAWEKARRGDLSALYSMGITLPAIAGAPSPETQAAVPLAEQKTAQPVRRTNGNAKAVELDL